MLITSKHVIAKPDIYFKNEKLEWVNNIKYL